MSRTDDAIQARRLAVVTASFRDLQGLVLVPVGVWMVVVAGASLLGLVREGDLTWFVTSIPVPVVGALLARRYYRRRYGEVRLRRRPVRAVLGWIALGAGWLLALYAVSYSYVRLGPEWIAVSLEGVLIAGVLALLAGWQWRLRRHWPALAGLLSVIALMPLGLLTSGPHPLSVAEHWSRSALALAVGVCLVIGGLGDHRVLVRSLDARRRTGRD